MEEEADAEEASSQAAVERKAEKEEEFQTILLAAVYLCSVGGIQICNSISPVLFFYLYMNPADARLVQP